MILHLPMSASIEALLRPRSLARARRLGRLSQAQPSHAESLIDKQQAGALYPVHPKYRDIAGLRSYAGVQDMPEGIDDVMATFSRFSLGPVPDGVRGKPPVDGKALAGAISAVSAFGTAAGPRLGELDLDPVRCSAHGAAAVDWMMLLREP